MTDAISEAVTINDKLSSPVYAGFWIRLVADVIDSVILSVASWLVEFVGLGLVYGVWYLVASLRGVTVPVFWDAFNSFWLQVLNVWAYLCLAFPYYVWGHYRYGTTLGKRPFNIYVVDHKTFDRISVQQSIGRFFAYGLSYVLLLSGFLMAGINPEKRALHDFLAGTASVLKRRAK